MVNEKITCLENCKKCERKKQLWAENLESREYKTKLKKSKKWYHNKCLFSRDAPLVSPALTLYCVTVEL